MKVVIVPRQGKSLLWAIEKIPPENRFTLPGVDGMWDDRTMTFYTWDECEIEDRRKRE